MYDVEHARIYDELYAAVGKDYEGEVDALTSLVRERVPGAASVLDVACGTGEHLRCLRGRFERVAGVELSPAMVRVAREKVEGVAVHAGDMRDFELGERFDAVLCMFSSIGYVGDAAGLERAVGAMAGHVAPGGVLVVESSFRRDRWREGHLTEMSARVGDRVVARVTRSSRAGEVGVFDVHLLIGDADGVRYVDERHELGLFTREQYEAAFERAGLAVEYHEDETFPRGLYLGRKS